MDSVLAENNLQPVASPPPREMLYTTHSKVIHEDIGFPAVLSGTTKISKGRYAVSGKRAADVFFSVILTGVLLSWLIPVFALIIKLTSKGPVFFIQRRNGLNGKIFSCIKFRTMRINDEADLATAKINDDRITAFGGFLRKNHLDELPQLLNVIAGRMSLVGPRPYMLKENLYYENILKNYALRHSVKPGITGLAQSLGYFGSISDMENARERFELDLLYIETRSFAADIKILCRTFLLMLGIKSGYQQKTAPAFNKTCQ